MKLKIILILSILVNLVVQADEVYTVIIRRQEEKKASRWTLSDWLMTKQRISLMDQWLSLNTESNFFDFSFSYDKYNFKQISSDEEKNYNDSNLNTKFFMSFIGLEANYEKLHSAFSSKSYGLDLRLLGSSLQSTHLLLKYGFINTKSTFGTDNLEFSSKYFEIEGNLYLLGFLGVSYKYHDTKKVSKDEISYAKGSQNYGVFLDLWILKFYLEKVNQTHTYDKEKVRDKGERVGVSILF